MKSLHHPHHISFASDNYSGVLPEVMEALSAANGGHVGAYGNDPYTEHLQTLIRQHFGDTAQVFPVFNGTGANVLALQACLPRWGSVICAETAHVHHDESVAPQAVGGFKLWTVPTSDGKLALERIDREAYGYGFEHRAQPLAVSITQSTELGTVYRPSEISAISEYCREKGMVLHMDGARLSNAAASLGASLREITTDAGVDIVSFGGTKNGLMFGECVIVLNPEKVSDGLKYLRKLNLQLASKMRFLSAQFIALLSDGLWLCSAQHANTMAARLSDGLSRIEGVELVCPTEANGVFARLPQGVADKLHEQFVFYDWDNEGTVRLMCSFDTRKADVDALVAAVKKAVEAV